MNNIADIKARTDFIGAETLKILNDLLRCADETNSIASRVHSAFGDQPAGQQIVMELSKAVRDTTNAAYEIGRFNGQAQQIIIQLSQ